jgi:hypothetical protein
MSNLEKYQEILVDAQKDFLDALKGYLAALDVEGISACDNEYIYQLLTEVLDDIDMCLERF